MPPPLGGTWVDSAKATATDANFNTGAQLAAFDHLVKESGRLLSGLGKQLEELGFATRPIATHGMDLINAERNIADTRAAVDELMTYLETSRKVVHEAQHEMHAVLDHSSVSHCS